MKTCGIRSSGRAACVLAVLVGSTSARADMVWPTLLLELHYLAVWAIAVGLVLEAFLVRWAFKPSLGRTVLATVTANALSTLGGVIAIPVLGLVAAAASMPVANLLGLSPGASNGALWVLSFALAVLVNTWIEVWIYRGDFRFVVGRREFAIIVLANGLSVGVAALNYVMHRPAV